MLRVGAFAAKAQLPALLKRVSRGEQVLITCGGKAVARLVPPERALDEPVPDPVAELRALRAGCTLGGIPWQELRDAGRR